MHDSDGSHADCLRHADRQRDPRSDADSKRDAPWRCHTNSLPNPNTNGDGCGRFGYAWTDCNTFADFDPHADRDSDRGCSPDQQWIAAEFPDQGIPSIEERRSIPSWREID